MPRKTNTETVPAPRTTPGDYKLNGEAVFHPSDPRAAGGIGSGYHATRFIQAYREAQPKYATPLDLHTRASIVASLTRDLDGRIPSPALRQHLAGLFSGEIPEALLVAARGGAALEGDPFAPLTDAELADVLGPALYRARSLFNRVRFVSASDVATMVEAFERDREQREMEAAEMQAKVTQKAEREYRERREPADDLRLNDSSTLFRF